MLRFIKPMFRKDNSYLIGLLDRGENLHILKSQSLLTEQNLDEDTKVLKSIRRSIKTRLNHYEK